MGVAAALSVAWGLAAGDLRAGGWGGLACWRSTHLGVFAVSVSATNPPTITEVGGFVYAEDDQTVDETRDANAPDSRPVPASLLASGRLTRCAPSVYTCTSKQPGE
jgi:hypothetical protein